MELNILLKQARLTRSELADAMGVHIKTTYNWKVPPKYVVSYLELHSKWIGVKGLYDAIRSIK